MRFRTLRIPRINIANPIALATGKAFMFLPSNRAVRVLAVFFYLPLWLFARSIWYFAKGSIYIVGFLLLVMALYVTVGIPLSKWYSSNEIAKDKNGNYYMVGDPEMTNMVRYLGGCGPLSADFELALVRDSIRSRYLRAGVTPPDGFEEYNMEQLEQLVSTWTTEDGYGIPRVFFNRTFAEFSKVAKESPAQEPGEDTCAKLWEQIIKHGSPQVSFIERQNDFIAILIAIFAPRGAQQAAYVPITNTIYVRYDDSLEVLRDEIPHAKQFSDNSYRAHWQWLMGTLRSVQCAPRGALTGMQRAYQNEYDRPGSLEYEAHHRDESLEGIKSRKVNHEAVLPYNPPVRGFGSTPECP